MKKYLISSPDDGSEDYAILGSVTSSTKETKPNLEHLACFIPGSLAMASKYWNLPQDMILAKKIAEACFQGYHQSVTGLGPEEASFTPQQGSDGRIFHVEDKTFYSRSTSRSMYILRPGKKRAKQC